jgi:hypothetical protein
VRTAQTAGAGGGERHAVATTAVATTAEPMTETVFVP